MCARLAGRDQRIHGHANIVTLGHFGDKKVGKILYVCEKQDFSSKKLVRTEKMVFPRQNKTQSDGEKKSPTQNI